MLAHTNIGLMQPAAPSYYGDGSDGAATLNGTNTYSSWSTKSGNVYTLTRDVQLSSLTISSGVTLKPAGYVVQVNGELLLNGLIHDDGGDASAHNGGAAGATGTAGATGVWGETNNASGLSSAMGASGGRGGTGQGGYSQGGTATAPGDLSWLNSAPLKSSIPSGLNAGCGGGHAGGWGGTAGAGGGGGGGKVIVYALYANGSGTLRARGGQGAGCTGGPQGGGGGGGGGWVMLVTSSASHSYTITATGGNGGAGASSEWDGVAGTNGRTNVFTSVS